MRRIQSIEVFAIVSATIGIITVSAASAADFGGTALRGSIAPPQQYQDNAPWDGFYVGGLGGYTSADVKSKSGAYSAIAPQVQGTSLDAGTNLRRDLSPSARNTRGGSYGAFVGYNTTWEDVVLGIEADYQRSDLKTDSSLAIGRQFVDTQGVNHNYTATSRVATNLTDIVTVRGRVGYAYGNALPYLTLGVAILHGTSTVRATVTDQGFDTTVPARILPFNTTYTGGYQNRDKYAVGVAVGGGVDYAFTPSIFLRAEYQFQRFNSFDGNEVRLSNARLGLAAKF